MSDSIKQTDARVLIVDDDPSILKVLERTAPPGCSTKTAASSIIALSLLETFRPDVVLLDLNMPGLTGFEFLEKLMDKPHMAHVRVIMITGMDDEETRMEAYSRGVDDFLGKPFSSNEVRYKIMRWAKFSRHDQMSRLKSEFLTRLVSDQQSPFDVAASVFAVLEEVVQQDEALNTTVQSMNNVSLDFVKRYNLFMDYLTWHTTDERGSSFPFSLASLMEPLTDSWKGICADRKIKLEVRDVPADLMVAVESKSLTRIIRWLLNNSVRHASSQVAVRCGQAEKVGTYIDFVDDGPGFDEDILPIVFDGFIAGNYLHLGRSIGLHLSLAAEIASSQGGRLHILDPGPGETVVRLELPQLARVRPGKMATGLRVAVQ
jgi:DNA-binding response OmpR family regulator